MAALGRSASVLGIAAFGLLISCSSGETPQPNPSDGSGGAVGTGGTTSGPKGGSGGSASGGSSATGGSAQAGAGGSGSGGSDTGGTTGTGGSGTGGAGTDDPDASTPDTGGSGPATDGGTTGPDVTTPTGPFDFGGVGEQPLIPLVYTAQPVPPLVAMECPDDPTAGFTEYKDSFVVQRPRNLAAKDRFKYEDGIYTTWILPGDQPHKAGNATKPRTETRFSDLNSGEHIMSFDVKVESGINGTVIHQYKSAGTKGGNIGIYIEMNGGTLKDQGRVVATGVAGKWINIKTHYNIATGEGHIWVNNCLKETTNKEKNAEWYFKFGNYHCDGAPKCEASFKNIHFFQKNSTDQYNVKSKTP
jgi:hypothetical protein